MIKKTITVGELKVALANLNDTTEVLVMGICDGDLVAITGIDKEETYDGVVGLKVAHAFPEEWYCEDSEGSRWDKEDNN